VDATPFSFVGLALLWVWVAEAEDERCGKVDLEEGTLLPLCLAEGEGRAARFNFGLEEDGGFNFDLEEDVGEGEREGGWLAKFPAEVAFFALLRVLAP